MSVRLHWSLSLLLLCIPIVFGAAVPCTTSINGGDRNCCPTTGYCQDSSCTVFGLPSSAQMNCASSQPSARCAGSVCKYVNANCVPHTQAAGKKNEHCYGIVECLDGSETCYARGEWCLENGNSDNFKICRGAGRTPSPSQSPSASPSPSPSQSPSASPSPSPSQSPSPSPRPSPSPAPVIGCDRPSDIIIMMDRSGSIDGDWPLEVNFVRRRVEWTSFANGSRIGVVAFDWGQVLACPLSSDATALINCINSIPFTQGGTNIYAAINFAASYLTPSSDPNRNYILQMITDGEDGSGLNAASAAQAVKNRGIQIQTIGVGAYIKPAQLQAIASAPASKYYVPITNFQALEELARQQICPSPQP